MNIEYWKKRCELAEMYIEECPCDPDITMQQLAAYSAWNDFKDNLEEAIKSTELTDKPKLNFGDWKFSQGLRYVSDFTYKNAKGELFDADVVNNTYNDYYNL